MTLEPRLVRRAGESSIMNHFSQLWKPVPVGKFLWRVRLQPQWLCSERTNRYGSRRSISSDRMQMADRGTRSGWSWRFASA